MSTPAYAPIAPTAAQQEAARTLHGLWTRRARFAALPESIRPATRREGYAVQQAFEQIRQVNDPVALGRWIDQACSERSVDRDLVGAQV